MGKNPTGNNFDEYDYNDNVGDDDDDDDCNHEKETWRRIPLGRK